MVLGIARSSSTSSLAGNGSALNRTPSASSLTKAFKRFNSRGASCLSRREGCVSPCLTSATHAMAEADVNDEEIGDWKYLIIDQKGIRLHSAPNYSKETKSEKKLPQGVIVEVERRRKTGWTTFLGLKGTSGKEWLFDVSPKDKSVRMIEVEVLEGDWKYESCVFERIPVLPYPIVSANVHVARSFLEANESVSVSKRMRPVSGKGSFLKLADGRGWVLDFADGRRILQKWSPEGHDDISEPSTSSSDLSGAFSENSLGPPEYGTWEYIVLDARGMTMRKTPTFDASEKSERRIHEGEVVTVTERRAGEGMTFLHLDCPQGWVFDRSPGKNSKVRMMEANMERGSWHYVVTAESGIALRTRCSFAEATKCGKGPLRGSLIEICQRVRAGATTFLQLKEGGQWIFDSKQGRKLLSGPFQLQVPACSQAMVRSPDGVHLLESPTAQKWAVTKMKLLQHAQVELSKVFNIEFTTWGFVEKPGSNMKGWVRMSDLCTVDASSASSDLRNCAATSNAFVNQITFHAEPFRGQAFATTQSSEPFIGPELFIGPLKPQAIPQTEASSRDLSTGDSTAALLSQVG